MKEIERKFLVKQDMFTTQFIAQCSDVIDILQGYLTKNENGAVRIRVESDLYGNSEAYLMSKVKLDGPMSNEEEKDEIFLDHARVLLDKFVTKLIHKRRYIRYVDGKKWEIDEFYTPNQGLILAEIELTHENEEIVLPDWIEREVTGEAQYYNANM